MGYGEIVGQGLYMPAGSGVEGSGKLVSKNCPSFDDLCAAVVWWPRPYIMMTRLGF